LENAKPGVKVSALCEMGDRLINEQVLLVRKKN